MNHYINPQIETPLINTLENGIQDEFEQNTLNSEQQQSEKFDKNAFTQQSIDIQQQKSQKRKRKDSQSCTRQTQKVNSEIIFKFTTKWSIYTEESGYKKVKKWFPKIAEKINIYNYGTFFRSIEVDCIQKSYPKYFFILCLLWIRPNWINEIFGSKYEYKYDNWDKMCDFNQPLKPQNFETQSCEKLKKVKNQYKKCEDDSNLRSYLNEFHTLCTNNKIVIHVDRFITFKEFWIIMDLINKQCMEEKITDSDLLTHIEALKEFASKVEQLKQNTVRKKKKAPKMKKTIDIYLEDIEVLFQIPEIDVYQSTIMTQIDDIINMDKICQDDKEKWILFKKLVLTIFKKDPNVKNSSKQSKKHQKSGKQVQKSEVDQFVDDCLKGDSVQHSIDN